MFPGSAHPKGMWSSEDDHLAQYMEVLGPMPRDLLLRGSKTKTFFDEDGMSYPTVFSSSGSHSLTQSPTGNLLRIPRLHKTSLEGYVDGEIGPLRRPADMRKEDVPQFVDFLKGMLALDPAQRKTASELLQHPWLST